MNKIKEKGLLPYLIIMFGNFYLIPFFIYDTGTAMIILLFIIPFICFALSFLYGMRKGFFWLYPILVSFLFVPSIFLFYNSSASIYILIYGIVALIGEVLGNVIKMLKTNKI